MGTLLLVLGLVWAFLGAANIVAAFANTSLTAGWQTFGIIFNMVVFILPGLAVAGLGELLRRKRRAGLVKLDGSLWHAYRRKWAIERKHLPLRDVAAAGGWKDVNTLLEVYQQADEGSVLLVTSETRKLRERGVA